MHRCQTKQHVAPCGLSRNQERRGQLKTLIMTIETKMVSHDQVVHEIQCHQVPLCTEISSYMNPRRSLHFRMTKPHLELGRIFQEKRWVPSPNRAKPGP